MDRRLAAATAWMAALALAGCGAPASPEGEAGGGNGGGEGTDYTRIPTLRIDRSAAENGTFAILEVRNGPLPRGDLRIEGPCAWSVAPNQTVSPGDEFECAPGDVRLQHLPTGATLFTHREPREHDAGYEPPRRNLTFEADEEAGLLRVVESPHLHWSQVVVHAEPAVRFAVDAAPTSGSPLANEAGARVVGGPVEVEAGNELRFCSDGWEGATVGIRLDGQEGAVHAAAFAMLPTCGGNGAA